MDNRLEEIRQRRALIVDAPWLARQDRDLPDEWCVTSIGHPERCTVAQVMFEGEADFVAHTPEDIDYLLSLVDTNYNAGLEAAAKVIIDFHDWVWCDCFECKHDARSHAVKTEASLTRIATAIRALKK